MLIRDLFLSNVTRDIPPVVYFHEQSPEKLRDEVSEYIITGGWPEQHPNHRRVPHGIHEQYVRLLTAIASELEKPGGPELPASWISGFYGSGKSSFAKLLGLALDTVTLSNGETLGDALLKRDTSPRSAELHDAWQRLQTLIKPIAVVFDIGGVARDNEQIHSAIVRQVQKRLGYCSTEPLVADFELRLERDGEWQRFEQRALEVLGRPWSEVKDRALAEEEFSLVLSELFPDRYTDPMSWFTSRSGTFARVESAEEATRAIQDMLKFRMPGRHLFLVVDEVSQYIHQDTQRMLALQSFVSELGQRLKGKVWLLVTGQEKLEDTTDAVVLGKMKDRFPAKLRVHLAASNIRDVVHKRLLQKKPEAETRLRKLYQTHRAALKLFAYQGEQITEEDFVEVYPMLPGHIDLLLQLTSALRARSSRSQGDDQAIRGLLQLLGELFRARKLADRPEGTLVTLDEIYEIQHTALDSDVQSSMIRLLNQLNEDSSGWMTRVAKAVSLLELIQESMPTDAKLVAACLYGHLGQDSIQADVTEALEELRRRNLLGYSEKLGYKIQSSTGEEWERERREIGISRDQISELLQEALKFLLATPEQPRLQGRPFPWGGFFSDGRRADDVQLQPPRDEAAVLVDFRFLPQAEASRNIWLPRSDETGLRPRLLWVCGEIDQVEHLLRELGRSMAMARKYKARRESLNPSRKLLLQQEDNRAEELQGRVQGAVEAAFMAGRFYFRGLELHPRELGSSFANALLAAGNRILPDLFPHFIATQVTPGELLQLVQNEPTGVSPKFLPGELGILELDGGRYVPACSGMVPRRIQEYIEHEGGVGGTTLLSVFGGPPYGYTSGVVRACLAGLLRAGKIKIQQEDGTELAALRDAGASELITKDRPLRRASIFPAGEDDIGFKARARICKFFEEQLDHRMDREDHAIADAVASLFPGLLTRLRSVYTRLNQLPNSPATPVTLEKLEAALEECIRSMRQTKPTVRLVKRHMDVLREGLAQLSIYDAELTKEAIQAVRAVADVLTYQVAQLREVDALEGPYLRAAEHIESHLAGERPWREISVLGAESNVLKEAYIAERRRLLEWQESRAGEVRARVKARRGYDQLNADQSHRVLRPIVVAMTDTTAEAIAPVLKALHDPFLMALQRAEDKANEALDELLSAPPPPPIPGTTTIPGTTVVATKRTPIVTVDLSLRNREIHSEADLDAMLKEIRKRVEAKLGSGVWVRVV